MPDPMQRYVTIPREMPQKRAPQDRVNDFAEVYERVNAEEMRRQASRCEQCGVPYCQTYCPLGNNIPDWLRATAEGRLKDAYQLSQATNNLPEICGRICPQDRLCEAKWACTLEQSGHGTVTIGAVEKHITDTAWQNGWVTPRLPDHERKSSIGIVGAGPAGMTAAEELRALGHQVVIYDRYAQIGGLMLYGIPSFKLEKDLVQRRAKLLLDQGVVFRPNSCLGDNLDLMQLRQSHDAVILAYGAYRARGLGVPGTDQPGVLDALSYLVDTGRHLIGEIPTVQHDCKDRRVVVIGGGDTAKDCVRTAVRQQAKSVTCLYRRDQANMPGSRREHGLAQEEGVEFDWLVQPNEITPVPVEFIPTQSETIETGLNIRALRTRLVPDQNGGRQRSVPIAGSEFTFAADVIINALGFGVTDVATLAPASGLAMNAHGTIATRTRSSMTDIEGVYAIGDAARGPSLVVWAIKDGRDAAAEIHAQLTAENHPSR